MDDNFSLSRFEKIFPDDRVCLEEIIKRRFPGGIVCNNCQRITKHYKIHLRPVYACKFCRAQTFPLTGTLFEKSSTPLRKWYLALYLMTQTRANVSARILQNELSVTYKTAWRMHKNIYKLMQRNKGDLLTDTHISKWVIFNTIELKVVRKNQ